MLYGEDRGSEPAYILGFRFKYLLRSVIWFALSLTGAYFAGNEFVALHGVNNSGAIYFGLNLAGIVSIIIIILSFSTVIGGMGVIVGVGRFLSTGQIRLFDDHAVWKRRGQSRRLDYSEFTDAYFGYQAVPLNSQPSLYYHNQNYVRRRLISFYIGNKRFSFTSRGKRDLDSFLESRILKKNIDVEDDE